MTESVPYNQANHGTERAACMRTSYLRSCYVTQTSHTRWMVSTDTGGCHARVRAHTHTIIIIISKVKFEKLIRGG